MKWSYTRWNDMIIILNSFVKWLMLYYYVVLEWINTNTHLISHQRVFHSLHCIITFYAQSTWFWINYIRHATETSLHARAMKYWQNSSCHLETVRISEFKRNPPVQATNFDIIAFPIFSYDAWKKQIGEQGINFSEVSASFIIC